MKNLGEGKPTYDYILTNSEAASLPTNIPDGSTAYIVDTKTVKIFYNGTWYDM